jgi:hypothetical protein
MSIPEGFTPLPSLEEGKYWTKKELVQAIRDNGTRDFVRHFGLLGSVHAAAKSRNHDQLLRILELLHAQKSAGIESQSGAVPGEALRILEQLALIVNPDAGKTKVTGLSLSETEFFLKLISQTTGTTDLVDIL